MEATGASRVYSLTAPAVSIFFSYINARYFRNIDIIDEYQWYASYVWAGQLFFWFVTLFLSPSAFRLMYYFFAMLGIGPILVWIGVFLASLFYTFTDAEVFDFDPLPMLETRYMILRVPD